MVVVGLRFIFHPCVDATGDSLVDCGCVWVVFGKYFGKLGGVFVSEGSVGAPAALDEVLV